MLTSLIDHSRHETTKGFKATSYPGGAFGGILGIEEEGCDIYADLECADRTWGSDGK
jgi:hypothetical protein